MAVVLVPVVAASFIGLIGTPALRLLRSSRRTKDWASRRNSMHRKA